MTGNIEQRIWQHKNRAYDGFSATYNCNRLVWFERYASPEAAIAREKQLKGWRRSKKLMLIEQTNASWLDLSDNWQPFPPLFRAPVEPEENRRLNTRMVILAHIAVHQLAV
jgi:putative endonuclease